LIDPDCAPACSTSPAPDDFYREAHRAIMQCVSDLLDAHIAVDLITLTDELARRGKLEDAGGISYVSSLANQVPTSANAEYYARIVARTAVLRRLIHAAGQIAAVAYNEPDEEVALDQADRLIADVRRARLGITGRYFDEVLDAVADDWLARMEGDSIQLVRLGNARVDHALGGGMEGGEIYYIGGRPRKGKTSVAWWLAGSSAEENRRLTEAAHAAGRIDEHYTTVYFALEQKPEQLARKAIAWRSSINTRLMRKGFRQSDGQIAQDRYLEARDARLKLREEKGRYLIQEKGPKTFTQIRSALRTYVREHGCRVAFIDQLDLIRDDSHLYTGEPQARGEYERVTAICRALKSLAVELDIPLIVLAQLNRDSVKGGEWPTLESFKGTGQIEQDADGAFAVHDPVDEEEDDEAYKRLRFLVVLKMRDGQADRRIPYCFEEEYGGRVSEWQATDGDPDAMLEEAKARAAERAADKKAGR
jgi:replicative DNA helicase